MNSVELGASASHCSQYGDSELQNKYVGMELDVDLLPTELVLSPASLLVSSSVQPDGGIPTSSAQTLHDFVSRDQTANFINNERGEEFIGRASGLGSEDKTPECNIHSPSDPLPQSLWGPSSLRPTHDLSFNEVSLVASPDGESLRENSQRGDTVLPMSLISDDTTLKWKEGNNKNATTKRKNGRVELLDVEHRTLSALSHDKPFKPVSGGGGLLPREKPPVSEKLEINDIVIKDSDVITIGSEINAQDLTINQFVNLGSLSPTSQVTLAKPLETGEAGCHKFRNLWAGVIIGVIIAVAVSGATLASVDFQRTNEDEDNPGGDSETNYTLRLVSHSQWSQHKNPSVTDLPQKPARYVVLCHTGSSFCDESPTCINTIRSSESWNINSGMVTIAYNFLIAGDGYIYEGRGWDKTGSHTRGFNCFSLGVAFVGNFDEDRLSTRMREAYMILVAEGLRRGALKEDYKLVGVKQLKNSASPGKHIMEEITSWPHWGPVTSSDVRCPT